MYVCFKCGKEVEYKDIKKKVRCPFCGSKILFKKRPEVVKKVKAR